jgi:hypothetical protein
MAVANVGNENNVKLIMSVLCNMIVILAIVMTEENEMKKMTLSGVIGNDENNVI